MGKLIKKKLILGIVVVFSIPVYPVLGADKKIIVTTPTAPLYKNFADNRNIGSIDLGVPVNTIRQQGTRIQFTYKGQDVWINQKDVGVLNSNAKTFVDTTVLFAELPIVDEKEFWFVYKNNLYVMDLEDLNTPDFKLKSSLPNFSYISASDDRSLLALTGSVVSNDIRIVNIALYNTLNRNFIPLTFLSEEIATINILEFSQNNRYLALFFALGDDDILQIYDMSNQQILGSYHNVLSFNWIDSSLFVYTSKNIMLYEYTEDRLEKVEDIYTFKTVTTEAPIIAQIEDQVLFDIEGSIYQLDNKKLIKTVYKSLERSASGSIEYYTDRGQTYTTYQGTRLRSLSGRNPQWTFISILDDELLLYRQQKDALQILQLYNGEKDESYPYYWIEDPFYTFKNGLSMEIVIEDQEIFLFFEKAGEWVKQIPIHQLLK